MAFFDLFAIAILSDYDDIFDRIILDKQKCGRIKRLISTTPLNPLLDLHVWPIKVLFSDQSMKPNLRDSFALICFQRLS